MADQELLRDANFWFTVSFVIFVVAAWIMGRKPIAAFFDNYAARIRTELDESARLHVEAAALLAQAQQKQAGSIKEAAGLVAYAQEQAKLMRVSAEKELEAALARRRQQMLDRIRVLEEQIAAEIRATTVDLALKAAEQILRDKLSEDQDQLLIAQHIGRMTHGLKKVA